MVSKSELAVLGPSMVDWLWKIIFVVSLVNLFRSKKKFPQNPSSILKDLVTERFIELSIEFLHKKIIFYNSFSFDLSRFGIFWNPKSKILKEFAFSGCSWLQNYFLNQIFEVSYFLFGLKP